MFTYNLLGYMLGYITVEIEGYYIERFVNICKSNNIKIWNIERKNKIKIKICIYVKEFKKVCKIAQKTKCKIRIIRKIGIPFLFFRYRKRKISLFIIVIGIFVFSISTRYIWNIEIKNMDEITFTEAELREKGLSIGKNKNDVDSEKIINEIMMNREDIAWIGIEIKGTNAIVNVKGKKKAGEIKDEDEYCNIVANKRGIINEVDAQNGMANVKKGDLVKEGDILIKGWMEGKYTGVRYVNAEGKVEAIVSYSERIEIPYDISRNKKTGNKEEKYKIKINNFTINLYKSISKFQKYDTMETENKIKVGNNIYLPISIIKIVNEETKNEIRNMTKEEAEKLGKEEIKRKIEEIEKNDKLINKNIYTYEKEEKLEMLFTYELLEEIGTKEKIIF